MSFGLFLLRLVLGGIFAAHGYPKLFGGAREAVPAGATRYLGPGFAEAVERGPRGFAGMLRGMGVPAPEFAALGVGAVEFFGGLALALGWHTRLAALALSGDMAVAIARVHWRHGLSGPNGFEFPLSLLAGCLALLLGGPGRVSLDHLAGAGERPRARARGRVLPRCG